MKTIIELIRRVCLYIKSRYHIYVHRRFSYSLPSAGKYVTWDCQCIECGATFQVRRRNTPQWVSPIFRDKTQPKTWAEWEKLHLVS